MAVHYVLSALPVFVVRCQCSAGCALCDFHGALGLHACGIFHVLPEWTVNSV